MPPVSTQTMPPSEHLGQSRLVVIIISLVIIAAILAIIFIIYLQPGKKIGIIQPINNVLTAQAKAQDINEMQSVVQSKPAIGPTEKAALIRAMSAKLQSNK